MSDPLTNIVRQKRASIRREPASRSDSVDRSRDRAA